MNLSETRIPKLIDLIKMESCASESKKKLNYSVSVDKKMCPHCKAVKSKTEFSRDKYNRTGLQTWCKTCVSESRKKVNFPVSESRKKVNFPVSVDEKMCFRCKVVKSKTEFVRDKSDRTGLLCSCKTCKREFEKERLKDVKSFLSWLYTRAKTRAKKRKTPFEISLGEWVMIYENQEGKCAETGIKMTWISHGEDNTNKPFKYLFNISPDQIVSGKGYTVDNVQFVCGRINSMKGDMTTEDFHYFCQKVTTFSETIE